MVSLGIQLDMKCSRFCSLFLYSAGGAVFCLGYRCFNSLVKSIARRRLGITLYLWFYGRVGGWCYKALFKLWLLKSAL